MTPNQILSSLAVKAEENVFRQIFRDLRLNGKKLAPRGLEILELENYTYELPPYARFCNFKSRNLKLDYIKREFLWYLRADPKDLSILKHAKMWESLVNADGTINSNYGQYLFNTSGGRSQFNYVIEELARDKDSRRASMVILRKEHLLSDTKDYPCTYSLNFRIRSGKLNMSVHMRSQDAAFGMGNDAPCFSFTHELLCQAMKWKYPDLELGNYHHITDSFHVYARHYDVMEAIAGDDPYSPVDCPRIGVNEVDGLITTPSYPNESSIFHNWLYTYEKEQS